MTTAHCAIRGSLTRASIAAARTFSSASTSHYRPVTLRVVAANRCLSIGPVQTFSQPARPTNSSIYANAGGLGHQLTSPISSSAKEEDEEVKANKSIVMNPNGYSKEVLPGNFVMKKNQRTGVERKVIAERKLGVFWMIKDLNVTDNKPILSNDDIVPPQQAELFPEFKGLSTLTGIEVDLPDYFTRKNRAKDATAQCTLVVISYNDFGYKMGASWIDPFESALRSGGNERRDRVEVVRISINEKWILKMLRGAISSGFKKSIPEECHESTLLYFGDSQHLKDMLRMHNTLTGYCFLLDGIGRVRWSGSGTGTEEEVQNLIECAKQLTPASPASTPKPDRQRRRGASSTRPSSYKRGATNNIESS